MIRQYRIDRFNGLEVLVCEIFRKHTFTQAEYEAFHAWKLKQEATKPPMVYLECEFRADLDEWLQQEHDPKDTFFGISDPVPVYDYQPHIVLRGVIVDNRIASLQVDYTASVLPPEVMDAVTKFYGVMDSRHWRDMVDHQHQKYGSLFESPYD